MKIVRLFVESVVLVSDRAPVNILLELTFPSALAKGLVVYYLGRLKRARHVHPLGIAPIETSCRIRFAWTDGILGRGDTILEQSMELIQLALGDADGIFQHTPMVRVGSIIWACKQQWQK